MARVMTLIHTCICVVVILQIGGTHAIGPPQVPGFFIFGDSLSDSGNNNNLISLARADFPPYGCDFPGGATGRFCNGRTVIDLIGDHLGLDSYIKPYPQARDETMAKGVNYASGSAGILPETGLQVGGRVPMDDQLKNHQKIVQKLEARLGQQEARAHLKNCLFSVYAGSNDWMLNFFSGGSLLYVLNTDIFGDRLIRKLTQQITSLYELGARKVIVFGMAPLGCLPPVAIFFPFETCSSLHNNVLVKYNNKLKSMVEGFNSRYPDAKFIWINSMDIVTRDMKGLGLKKSPKEPCCGIEIECLPFNIPCFDREDRTYWDCAHPTEAANRPFAARAYKARDATDSYPMDISQLAALQL